MMAEDNFKQYMEWVAEGTVFFVRPHRDLLKEDGTRAGVTWESVLRIDGMVKFMLEQSRIPYLPLESASMQERARGRLRARPDRAAPGAAAPRAQRAPRRQPELAHRRRRASIARAARRWLVSADRLS